MTAIMENAKLAVRVRIAQLAFVTYQLEGEVFRFFERENCTKTMNSQRNIS